MQISGGEGYDGSHYSLEQAKDIILRKIKSDPHATYTIKNMGSTVGLGYSLCSHAVDSLVASGLLEKSPYMPPGASKKDYCFHLPGIPSNRASEYAASQRREAALVSEQPTLALGDVDTKAPLPRSGPDKAPRVVTNPGHPTKMGETENIILAYIRNHPGASSPEIQAATGFSAGKVGGPLWRLEHERWKIYAAGKTGRTRMFVAYEDADPEPEPDAIVHSDGSVTVKQGAQGRRKPMTLEEAHWLRCMNCGAFVSPNAKEHRC